MHGWTRSGAAASAALGSRQDGLGSWITSATSENGSAVNDELLGVFDRMASSYDSKSARMAPINNGLHFLLESVVDGLPEEMHDAATCFLGFQFILDPQARSGLFRQIAERFVPGGILANSDLSADVESEDYDALLAVWQRVMATSGVSAEGLDRMKSGYAKDVAILPPVAVASIIEGGGFDIDAFDPSGVALRRERHDLDLGQSTSGWSPRPTWRASPAISLYFTDQS